MALSDQALLTHARRAYELGRFRAQAWLVLPVFALAAVALHFNRRPDATFALAGALLLVTLGLRWRGQGFGAGVVPGLMGGAVAFLLPLLACGTGFCSRTVTLRLLLICSLAGALAGAVLTVRALKGYGCSLACVASAGAVAALTASLSCNVAGIGGIAGMLVGLAAASGPAFVLARQH